MAPLSAYDSGAVYRTTHGTQGPFTSAANIQGYFSILGSGLQQAGPNLNPTTFESAVLTLPAAGGTPNHALIKFGPGDFTGVSDARIIFWDTSRAIHQVINGKAGTVRRCSTAVVATASARCPSRTFAIPESRVTKQPADGQALGRGG